MTTPGTRRGALVLAGGRSTRMGRDKASLPWGPDGGTLLQHVVARLADVVGEVLVVARRAQVLPALPADVRVVHDEVEDLGPLGGLLAGLRAAQADAVFATACDTPWLRRAVVEQLFEAQPAGGVAVATTGGFAHPLAAVYPRAAADEIAALLAAGRRRPLDLFGRLPTAAVEEPALRAADPDLVTLLNLNEPDDLAAARARTPIPEVRIEVFERARQLAGTDGGWVPGRTLRAALAAAAVRWPALVPHVLTADGTTAHGYGVSLEGRGFLADPDAPLDDGMALVLVNALAGG